MEDTRPPYPPIPPPERPEPPVPAAPLVRRQYTAEQKAGYVAVTNERMANGESLLVIAKDLDLGESALRRWVNKEKGIPEGPSRRSKKKRKKKKNRGRQPSRFPKGYRFTDQEKAEHVRAIAEMVANDGVNVEDACGVRGITNVSYYKWRSLIKAGTIKATVALPKRVTKGRARGSVRPAPLPDSTAPSGLVVRVEALEERLDRLSKILLG